MAEEIETPDTEKPKLHVVPLYELEKERKQRQALEAKLAEVDASAKRAKEAEMTETEKIMSRIRDLEPYAAEVERYRTRDAKRRDALIAALPVTQRDRLVSVLDGLTPDKAIDLLEAIETSPPKSAGVIRGGESHGTRMPTVDEIKQNPDILREMTREQRDAVYSSHGLQFTRRK